MKNSLLRVCTAILLLSLVPFLFGCNEQDDGVNTVDSITNETEPVKNAKEILVDYLKENGTSIDNVYYITTYEKLSTVFHSGYHNYFIRYDEGEDEVYFDLYIANEKIETPSPKKAWNELSMPIDFFSNYSHATLEYDYYYQYYAHASGRVEGNVDKRIFSMSNDTINDITIESLFTYDELESEARKLAEEDFKYCVGKMLSKANDMLKDNGVGISLVDLGFTNYQ